MEDWETKNRNFSFLNACLLASTPRKDIGAHENPQLSRVTKNTWRDGTFEKTSVYDKVLSKHIAFHENILLLRILPFKVLFKSNLTHLCHIILLLKQLSCNFEDSWMPWWANIILFQWVKHSFLWLHLSSQVLRCDMRRCDAILGFDKKKHRSPSSRHELCRCAGEIHIFVKILGSKFGLVLLDTHKRFILICWICFGSRVYSVQLMSITIERPCCPHGWCLCTQLRDWFQLPENCLRGDTGGDCKNGLIMSHLSGIWIESLSFEYCKKRKCS